MRIILSWKNFNYMLAIDILSNYLPKYLGVLRGDFWGLGFPKDALLAKTIAGHHM